MRAMGPARSQWPPSDLEFRLRCIQQGVSMGWKASDIPDLTGRVAVVTGGNGGLGLATSMALAAHGATVVIGARNLAKAEAARTRILAGTPGAALEICSLDLG